MNPEKIIVRMPNWIGDLVMATPVLVDLRAKFPKAEITAMCRSPLCELLEREEAVDEIYAFSRPANGFLRREGRRDIIAKIAAGKHDVGILLTNSFSSAWWFWKGRVERRIGYGGNWRRWLLTDVVERERLHQVDVYKKLLEPLGVTRSETEPRLCVGKEEVEEARQLILQRGYVAGKKLVGINPGAAYGSAKCWLPERFRELALRLVEDPNVWVLFFGDGATLMLVKEICQGLPDRVMNLAGVTSLRELVCLIQECNVLVTNDSGPMHVAAAMGVPLVALFGSTDDEVTGPYGQRDAMVNKRVECAPCMRRVCPIDFRCMTGISVDEVVERVRRRV